MRILCKSPSNKILSFPRTPTPVRELETRAEAWHPACPVVFRDAKRRIDSLRISLPEYFHVPTPKRPLLEPGALSYPLPAQAPLIRMTSPCFSVLGTWWPPQGTSQNTLQSQKGMLTQAPLADRITRPQKRRPPKERLELGNYVVKRADNDRKRQSQKTTRRKGNQPANPRPSDLKPNAIHITGPIASPTRAVPTVPAVATALSITPAPTGAYTSRDHAPIARNLPSQH
jgi:hypothetical protein